MTSVESLRLKADGYPTENHVMRQPSVILIGGPPMIGKTTTARRLAARLDYGLMSTDDVGQSIQAVTTPDSHPELHTMSGIDYREYYVSRSTERLIQDAEGQHQATWPAVEAVVRSHADWAGPIVIEGWTLMPEAVASLNLRGVASLWMVTDEGLLEQRIRSNQDFWRGASDEELMIQRFLERSVWHNNRTTARAEQLGLKVVYVEPDATPDELCDLCLRTL